MKFKKLQKINGKGSKKHQGEWKKETQDYGGVAKKRYKIGRKK